MNVLINCRISPKQELLSYRCLVIIPNCVLSLLPVAVLNTNIIIFHHMKGKLRMKPFFFFWLQFYNMHWIQINVTPVNI